MATMTIAEAERILSIVFQALQLEKRFHVLPLSLLQGYDVIQFDCALKLRMAGDYLSLANTRDFEQQFARLVGSCGAMPMIVAGTFVPDHEIEALAEYMQTAQEGLEKLKAEHGEDSIQYHDRRMEMWWREVELNPLSRVVDPSTSKYYPHLGSLETPASFGDYCKAIGSDDPLYWQKVYTRVGLGYTSSSPRGNERVYLE